MKFLIINGPNLNLMHFTEPGVAGQIDYNALLDYLDTVVGGVPARHIRDIDRNEK